MSLLVKNTPKNATVTRDWGSWVSLPKIHPRSLAVCPWKVTGTQKERINSSNFQPFVSRDMWIFGEVHSLKLACPLKRNYFNRKYIFQPSIFRGELLVSGKVSLHFKCPTPTLLQTPPYRHFRGCAPQALGHAPQGRRLQQGATCQGWGGHEDDAMRATKITQVFPDGWRVEVKGWICVHINIYNILI